MIFELSWIYYWHIHIHTTLTSCSNSPAIQWRPIPPSTGTIKFPPLLPLCYGMGFPCTNCSVLHWPQFSSKFRACLKDTLAFLCIWVFSDFRVLCTCHPFRKDLADQAHRHTGVCLIAFSALKALSATQFAVSYFAVSCLSPLFIS